MLSFVSRKENHMFVGKEVLVHASGLFGGDRQLGVVVREVSEGFVDVEVGETMVQNIPFVENDPMKVRMPTNYEFYCCDIDKE
jgi:hypothetical protein